MTIKRTLASLSICAALVAPHALAADLNTDAQKEAYSVGASFGKYLSGQLASQQEMGIETDLTALLAGVEDALKNQSELSNDDIMTFINARAERLNEKVEAENARIAAESEQKTKDFLAANAKKDGVTVTESGLQYEVLVEGQGDKPAPEDVVTVNFKGSLVDGTEFANTFAAEGKEATPAKVGLVNAIAGWNEGLQLMNVGATYRFTIPAELAYGDDGMQAIPPKAALVFEIELLETAKPGGHGDGHGMMGGMGGMGGMNGHP